MFAQQTESCSNLFLPAERPRVSRALFLLSIFPSTGERKSLHWQIVLRSRDSVYASTLSELRHLGNLGYLATFIPTGHS